MCVLVVYVLQSFVFYNCGWVNCLSIRFQAQLYSWQRQGRDKERGKGISSFKRERGSEEEKGWVSGEEEEVVITHAFW